MSWRLLQRIFFFSSGDSDSLIEASSLQNLSTSSRWDTKYRYSIKMSFRARQHQRSLDPVMNDFCWFWKPMIFGDGYGLNSPDICCTVEKTPGENLNRGSNPGPLFERQRCYPKITAVVYIIHKVFISLYFIYMAAQKKWKVGLLRWSGKPYLVTVKILLTTCTFVEELFIVENWNF